MNKPLIVIREPESVYITVKKGKTAGKVKSFLMGTYQCGYCRKIFQARKECIEVKKQKSCGCQQGHERRKKGTPDMYNSYHCMKSRCYNPKSSNYENYGGRGIEVCDRWLISSENFIEDMGPKPSAKHTLDRVDVGKDYSPDNCRWADNFQQANNKRSNLLYTYNNKTQSLTLWCRELELKYLVIRTRIKTLGWSIERAFTTPTK